MGIGVSIFLLAVGAILAFAVNVDASSGVDLDMVGVILMIVGAIGLLAALLFLNDTPWRRREIVEDPADDVVVRRRRG